MRRFSLYTALATLTLLVTSVRAQPAAALSAPQTMPTTAPATAPPPSSPAPRPSAESAGPPPTTILRLHADHIDFYYDRFLMEADGHVHLQTSDGFTVSGDAFSMDLKLNRFLVAGHVTIRDASGQVSGAALSDFLDFRRIYFVPVTTEPDRWTFLNGDLAHPVKGRVMPGDTFFFPQLSTHPSISATSAVIGTKTYVRFSGATTYLAGLPVPLGSYVVNFSSNQYFAQNSLSGASADLTWNVAGNTNTLTAVHLRYDPTYYTYLSFEQHFVGQHEYAVFSINPATREQKWWNLQLYDKLGSRFQIQSFTQFYTDQHWLSEPGAAQQTTYLNATYAFPHSYVSAAANLTNYNLLGPGSFQVPNSIAGNLSHPSQLQITASSFQNRIGNLPLFEQTFEGYGFNHDTVGPLQYITNKGIAGLQSFGGVVYTTIWNTVLGFTLFTPSVKLNNPGNPYATYYFNASFVKQRQWNSVPHYIDTTTTTASVSRQFSRPLNTYLSYEVMNVGDHYTVGGYSPCGPPYSVFCPPSLASFRGASTLRTLSLDLNFAPKPEFNAWLLVRHHDDFPIPVPGLFPLPANFYNILNQPLYSWYLGEPPYDATADVRFKVLPHMLLDVSRTLYFYGNPYRQQTWSPSFVVQLLPI